MKKLLSTFSILSLSLPFFGVAKANEYDFYSLTSDIPNETQVIYGVKDGVRTLLNSFQTNNFDKTWQHQNAKYDPRTNSIIIPGANENLPDNKQFSYWSFNLDTHEITELSKYRGFNGVMPTQDLIRRESDGSIHVGQNSAVFLEENGREKFWAQDANGKSIPIDITNGSKLLINGRDVEQSINNVGAMSAALTGLPTVPTDSKNACGLGTGTHGGDFAFSGGCASKVNEKLSINYAASVTMPGQEYAGDFEDKFSARAGFVWQLGESNKPTQISMNQKKEIDLKISKLENDNEELKNKNNEIISQNAKLLARLEKLENIAFKLKNNEGVKLSKGL